jgi:hypothetical protein
MGTDEITFDDLLAGEPASPAIPQTFAELLADGFPREGGLPALAAIQTMDDPGSRFTSLRNRYRQILELQRR